MKEGNKSKTRKKVLSYVIELKNTRTQSLASALISKQIWLRQQDLDMILELIRKGDMEDELF